jgi:hypothetical protein
MTAAQNPLRKVLAFLDKLEGAHISYRLEHVRDSIMVVASVPGERWEIEFFDDCHVELERFISPGRIEDEQKLESLLSEQVEDY